MWHLLDLLDINTSNLTNLTNNVFTIEIHKAIQVWMM